MKLANAVVSLTLVIAGVGLLWHGGGPWVTGGAILLVWGNNVGARNERC